MKKIHLIPLVLLIISSCTKDKFGMDEITETNEYGDLIGNVNPNDWQVYNYSSVPATFLEAIKTYAHAEIMVNGVPVVDTTSIDYIIYHGIENGFFKTDNCSLPEFHMLAYPNPVKKGSRVFFSYTCSSDILYSTAHTTTKSGEWLTGTALGAGDLAPGEYITTSNVGNHDFTLYYLFVTVDSCVFWGKGNVKLK